jgi:hypothetical protein
MNRDKKIKNIIDALSQHESSSAVEILERVGTNSSDDEIRRLTAKALVNRNTQDALSVVILKEGKGINDLNTNVAMSTINELLALKDKSEALTILESIQETECNDTVKETARSLKALMAFS